MGPFTFPLFIAILTALTTIFLITRVRPDAPPVLVYFIIPLLIIYVVFQVLASVVPKAEDTGNRVGDYASAVIGKGIFETEYFQIFPTLFAVFFLFLVLLAAGFFKV